MTIVSPFIQLTDPAYQNIPMRDRLKGIVEELFRSFDSNGDGIIESFELSEMVSDVVAGITSILISLANYLESELLKAT